MLSKQSFVGVLTGLVTIFSLFALMSILLATLLKTTSLTEGKLTWVILFLSLIAMFIGGFAASHRAKEKGWLVGGITGGTFIIILLLIQYLGYDQMAKSSQYNYYILYLCLSVFGGIIGVNFSANRS